MDPFVLRRMVQGMTAGTKHWYRPRGPMTLDAPAERVMTLIEKRSERRKVHA